MKAEWWFEHSKEIRTKLAKKTTTEESYQTMLHSETENIFLWTVNDFHEAFNTLNVISEMGQNGGKLSKADLKNISKISEMGQNGGKLSKADLKNISKISEISEKFAEMRNEKSCEPSDMCKMLSILQDTVQKHSM